uniref:Global nitrogen transcriptional regulator n=1 Tax=Hydropuntia rangiferina TaxID=338881 RepID=A0A345U8M5_9FLOR|nr:global nitrogen transcriptional regulator [Hydropuntia rangiferina]AXI96811.1 global nitrogen transcriptional regulator [Hydropuntia rangiferina]UAD87491.1 global nitrogen transcriptional regulator [Hydropuntia rangiferina]
MNNQSHLLFYTLKNFCCVYKLYKGDTLIFKDDLKCNSLFIVFYGTVYVMKIFTNGESIFLSLLTSKSVINFSFSNSNYIHHKIIALENTYLIKFFSVNAINSSSYFSNTINLFNLFSYTLGQYEISSYILVHKSIKYRIIQLLLLLCRQFGILNYNYVLIPFEISQKTLINITGGNINAVNRVMNDLVTNLLVKYISKNKILVCYFSFFTYLNTNKII